MGRLGFHDPNNTAVRAAFAGGGAAAGAVVGSLIPGVGTLIGAQVGGLIGQFLFGLTRRPKKERGEQIVRTQTSTYGVTIPRVFGRCKFKGNIIWAPDVRPVKRSADTGGTSYRGTQGDNESIYVASWAVGLCEGSVTAVTRIWFDGNIVYDRINTAYTTNRTISNDQVTIYLGTETQTADPVMEAEEGVGNVPAYRGMCYLVFNKLPITPYDNRIPEVEAEVISSGTANRLRQNITDASVPADNMEISRRHPFIHYTSSGSIKTYDRSTLLRIRTRGVQSVIQSQISAGATIQGYPAFDKQDRPWVFAQTTDGRSFITRFGAPIASNFANRLGTTSKEIEGLHYKEYQKDGGYFITAEETNDCRIHCYNATTLSRIWSREGPATGAKPGNFTYDNEGRVWLISYLDADATKFYVSRITPEGLVKHFEITGHGRAKYVSFNRELTSLVCGGGDGKLTRISIPGVSTSVNTSLDAVSAASTRACFTSQRHLAVGTKFWSTNAGNLYRIKLGANTGSIQETIPLTDYSGSAGTTGAAFDSDTDAMWMSNAGVRLEQLFLSKVTFTDPTLSSAVQTICTKAGLSASDLDTTALTGTFRGYLLDRQSPARDALEPLVVGYSIDARETGFKIQFIIQGGASVASLVEDDVGATEEGGQATFFLEETRGSEQSLPQRVAVSYLSFDRAYDEAVQEDQRDRAVVRTKSQLQISLPLVLTDDEARKLAETLLYRTYLERTEYVFSALPKHRRLDPGDAVTVTTGGVAHTIRLTEVLIGEDRRVDLRGTFLDATAYASIASGAGTSTGDHKVTLPPPSGLYLLDIPILDDIDNDGGFYAAAHPVSAAPWSGTTLYRSEDGRVYLPIDTIDLAVTAGFAETVLPTADPTVFDNTNTVDVRLDYGTLTTVTQDDVIDRKNWALLGDEILGFKTVSQPDSVNEPDLWRLSGLLRGLRGTDTYALTTHAYGERFVLLYDSTGSRSHLRRVVPGVDGDVGNQRFWKGVSVGQDVTAVPSVAFTNNGIGLEPYAAVDLGGQKFGNDWEVTWLRRSRVGADLQDRVDIPVGEASEKFEIDIINQADNTVKRTITVLDTAVNSALTGTTTASAAEQSITNAGLDALGATNGAGRWLLGQKISVKFFSNAANNGVFKIVNKAANKVYIDFLAGYPILADETTGSGIGMLCLTPGCVYTSAQQVTDFGSNQSTLKVRVYQISATAGRGFVAEATF